MSNRPRGLGVLMLQIDGMRFASTVNKVTAIGSSPRFRIGRRNNATAAQSNADFDAVAYWIGYAPTDDEFDAIRNSGNGISYVDWKALFA